MAAPESDAALIADIRKAAVDLRAEPAFSTELAILLEAAADALSSHLGKELPSREEIARVVDPEAFNQKVKTRPMFDRNGRHTGYELLEPISLHPTDEMKQALSKADAIRALFLKGGA